MRPGRLFGAAIEGGDKKSCGPLLGGFSACEVFESAVWSCSGFTLQEDMPWNFAARQRAGHKILVGPLPKMSKFLFRGGLCARLGRCLRAPATCTELQTSPPLPCS